MFEAIKGIIGDIAAGTIKDQRIELSREQLAALDLKLRDTLAENTVLAKRVVQLEGLIKERNTEIAQLKSASPEKLDPKTLEILKFFFDRSDEDFPSEYIAHWFSLPQGVASYHVDTLRGRDLITLVGIAPARFSIHPEGRRYIMEHSA
jgi:hypothetical protein